MAVEEQIVNDTEIPVYAGYTIRMGQRLTISNRTVTKLAFLILKVGSPSGDITFEIRKVSDNSVIVSKVWGDAGSLQTSNTWEEATFDTPPTINEEVRVCFHYGGGDASKHVVYRYSLLDKKAAEYITRMISDSWTDSTAYDGTYRYTYGEVAGLENKADNMAAKLIAAGVL